jgi:hypothetical protein
MCDRCWRDERKFTSERNAKEGAAEKKPISAARRAALNMDEIDLYIMYWVEPDWFSHQTQIAWPIFSAQRSPAALAAVCASALSVENKPTETKPTKLLEQASCFASCLSLFLLILLRAADWAMRGHRQIRERHRRQMFVRLRRTERIDVKRVHLRLPFQHFLSNHSRSNSKPCISASFIV